MNKEVLEKNSMKGLYIVSFVIGGGLGLWDSITEPHVIKSFSGFDFIGNILNSVFFQTVAIVSGIYFAYKGNARNNKASILRDSSDKMRKYENDVNAAYFQISNMKGVQNIVKNGLLKGNSYGIANLKKLAGELTGDSRNFYRMHNKFSIYIRSLSSIYPRSIINREKYLEIFMNKYLDKLYEYQFKILDVDRILSSKTYRDELVNMELVLNNYAIIFGNSFEDLVIRIQRENNEEFFKSNISAGKDLEIENVNDGQLYDIITDKGLVKVKYKKTDFQKEFPYNIEFKKIENIVSKVG